MSADEYLQSLAFIESLWHRLGINVTHVSIQYVGGEAAAVPAQTLENSVLGARRFFAQRGMALVDDVQSSLVGSAQAVRRLGVLFKGRIGTSIDDITPARRIAGSAVRYRNLVEARERALLDAGSVRLPAVVVLDAAMRPRVVEQMERGFRQGRDITLRPALGSGRGAEAPDLGPLEAALVNAFDAWFMRWSRSLEPHWNLLSRLAQQRGIITDGIERKACEFQRDCARSSLEIEPNGDLFVCVDMADAGRMRLGNALRGEFDEAAWRRLDERRRRVDTRCLRCEFFVSCQGGCMSRAIGESRGPYGRSEQCTAWYGLQRRMAGALDACEEHSLRAWMQAVEGRERIALATVGRAPVRSGGAQ